MIALFRLLWCNLFHKKAIFPRLLWNGARQRWMRNCGLCGDWREPSKKQLEEKLTKITKVCAEHELGNWL